MQPETIDIRPEEPQPPRPPRRRSIVTPAILVIIGVAFLLNNFNLVSWNVWELLWKLWPVWLIAVGLDLIIGRRSLWGSVIGLIAVLAIVAGGVFYTGLVSPAGTPLDSEEVGMPVSGLTRADVVIRASVGRLRIDSTDGDALVDGRVRRLRGEQISQTATASNGIADYRLESRFSSIFPTSNNFTGPTWDLELSTRVPMDLTIGSGVGEADLDLEGLQVSRLKLETGIGETTVTLPGRGQYRAELEKGIGQTTVYIPRGLAARIHVNTGIGSVDVDGDFRRDGGYWVTPDYDTAANRVDLVVSGGIGEIDIRMK